jgi:hypothetical protein
MTHGKATINYRGGRGGVTTWVKHGETTMRELIRYQYLLGREFADWASSKGFAF